MSVWSSLSGQNALGDLTSSKKGLGCIDRLRRNSVDHLVFLTATWHSRREFIADHHTIADTARDCRACRRFSLMWRRQPVTNILATSTEGQSRWHRHWTLGKGRKFDSTTSLTRSRWNKGNTQLKNKRSVELLKYYAVPKIFSQTQSFPDKLRLQHAEMVQQKQ